MRKVNRISQEQDAPRIVNAAQDSINLLSAEILRLIRLPYKCWKNEDRIRSLDKQIEYLEHMLAQYEADLKKHG